MKFEENKTVLKRMAYFHGEDHLRATDLESIPRIRFGRNLRAKIQVKFNFTSRYDF
jgi:hypothetical protein